MLKVKRPFIKQMSKFSTNTVNACFSAPAIRLRPSAANCRPYATSAVEAVLSGVSQADRDGARDSIPRQGPPRLCSITGAAPEESEARGFGANMENYASKIGMFHLLETHLFETAY